MPSPNQPPPSPVGAQHAPGNWVWIDLEMTGLDPARCVILDVGVIVTDPELRELGSYEAVLTASEADLKVMEPRVREMHTSSGLVGRVLAAKTTLAQAEENVLRLVKTLCPPRTAHLAGNSVWQDRRFLEKGMPRLLEHLHYRLIDVSSLKVLVQAWQPAAAFSKPDKAHTAMADIRASLAELRHYRTVLFGR